MSLDPRDPRAHILLGIVLERNGRIEEAQSAFRNAAQLDPEDPRPWLELGMIAHVHERHEEAVAAFREAERRDPEYFSDLQLEREMFEASSRGRLYEP